MMVKIGLILGVIGTVFLALDVASPNILRNSGSALRGFAKSKFNPLFILKPDEGGGDKHVISAFLFVGGLLALIFILIKVGHDIPHEDLLNVYGYLLVGSFLLALAGSVMMNVKKQASVQVLMFTNFPLVIAITPLVAVCSLVTWIVWHLSGPMIRMEGGLIGENQALRFIGLILIISSFVLQYLGSIS